ncbi:MAG TPA: hypothetical protein VNK04_07055 [Gemmataceae bacterium]|nr:hypothetical protein [Gemmataceae bacterium]
MCRRTLWSGALLLVFVPALVALDDKKEPGTPKQQYDAVMQEYRKVYSEHLNRLRLAKTQEERRQVEEKAPDLQPFAARFLEVAEKNPKDPVAVEALLWITMNAPAGKEVDRAVAVLTTDHLKAPRLATVIAALGRSTAPGSEKLLRAVLEKNPDKNVQGQACLALAQNLKYQAEMAQRVKRPDAEQLLQQAEKLFERVVKEYGNAKDLRGVPLAQSAKPELFEIRHLSVGKTAPEIEGEDLDGVKFKLSDYRGKVVFLDFWGHW